MAAGILRARVRACAQVAKRIKTFEFNKATEPPPYYADRFAANFKAKFVATGEALAATEKI